MKRTKQQQQADGDLIQEMRSILLSLLKADRGDKCEECGGGAPYQIHHKRYGGDITPDDLALLCVDCHYAKHGRHRRSV